MNIKLGKLLIEHKLLTADQVNKALEAQRLYGGKLGTNLVELGLITDLELATFLGKQLGIAPAKASDFEGIPKEVLDLVQAKFAQQHKLIPLKVDQKVSVAISDPNDLKAVDELSFKLGKGIRAFIAPEIWIIAALERYFGFPREVRFVNVTAPEESIEGELTSILADLPTGPREKEPVDPEVPLVPLSKYTDRLLSCTSPEQIFQAVLEFLAPIFPRMALYLVKRETIYGLLVRGFAVHTTVFNKCQAPLRGQNLAAELCATQKAYSGLIKATPENQALFSPLQILALQPIALYPIPFEGSTMALLLGVPAEEHTPPRPDAGQIVMEVLVKAGLALEILVRRRKLVRISTSPA